MDKDTAINRLIFTLGYAQGVLHLVDTLLTELAEAEVDKFSNAASEMLGRTYEAQVSIENVVGGLSS